MMMDKKTLLENGILEQYILGETDREITLQIEALITKDASVKAALNALEENFETLGLENAIAPPLPLKTKVLAYAKGTETETANVVKLKTPNYYTIAAASIAALFIVGTFLMYNKLSTVNKQLQIVEQENTTLETTISTLNKSLETDKALYATLVHPETKQYILNNSKNAPQTKVVSYVNHDTKSVVVNTQRLPKLDEAYDYQMWADVEGEMISMGVLPKSEPLTAVTYIDHAESLNITIEPAGGNDHATVENLVTNVYLK